MAQDPSEIREQIAETRSELAGTVQELAQKADVKRRVRESVSESAAELQDRASQLSGRVREAVPDDTKDRVARGYDVIRNQPWIVGVVAGLLLLLVLGKVRRKH
jgi:ElaB/YqjD/DUF883 family membrane-anchored ribosome-binding protein